MIPNSQLYGHAKIRGDTLEDHVFCSKNKVEAIMYTVYKMDPLSIGNAAYSDCVKLFTIERCLSNSYPNYEERLSADLNKLNSIGESLPIPATLAA